MRILLIEDNPLDIIVIQEVIENTDPLVTVDVCETGDEAIDYMRDRVNKPDLIWLDLRIPGRTGKEVLKEFRRDFVFISIPVVVVTASRSQEDTADVYRLGANCFHTKPSDFDDFVNMIRSIIDFWFKTVELNKENLERVAN